MLFSIHNLSYVLANSCSRKGIYTLFALNGTAYLRGLRLDLVTTQGNWIDRGVPLDISLKCIFLPVRFIGGRSATWVLIKTRTSEIEIVIFPVSLVEFELSFSHDTTSQKIQFRHLEKSKKQITIKPLTFYLWVYMHRDPKFWPKNTNFCEAES